MPEISEKQLAAFRRAADITEIQQLIAAAISYRDKMDVMSIWNKLFAADDPEVTIELGEGGGYVGSAHAEAYMRWWDDFFHRPDGKRGWMDFQDIATPYITVSEDGLHARGQWGFFCPQAKDAMPYGTDERILTAMWICGKYVCEFKKVDDVWKILKFHQLYYLRTPYDLGWVKQADCKRVDPFFALMPDTPPRYYAYHPDAVYGGPDSMYNWGPFLSEFGE